MKLKRWILLLLCFFSLEAADLQNLLKEPAGQSSTQKQDLKPTQTVLSSSASESYFYSQPIIFVAHVVPVHLPATTPMGKVQFRVDNEPLAEQPLMNGSATWTISNLSSTLFTEHYIEAIYLGSEDYASSRDTWGLRIYPAETSSSTTSSPNPSLLGQAVKVTAHVSCVAPAQAIPKGSVDFQVNGNSLAIADLDAQGKASFSTSEISIGRHIIRAIYQGDKNFVGSRAELTQEVNKAHTTAELISSENPSVYGQSIVVTARITSTAGIPTGMVQFTVNGVKDGNAISLNAKGEAVHTLSDLSGGDQVIGVYYLGEERFNPSNTFFTQHVDAVETQAELISHENPSIYGKAIHFIGKVNAQDLQPVGRTQWGVDGKNYGRTQFISTNGQVEMVVPELQVGSHQIEFNFLGTENFKPSSARIMQQVEKANSSVALTSSANPSSLGEPVIFTATVSNLKALSGTIQFVVDGQQVGDPLTLDAKNQASLVITSELKEGEHRIIANYSGNENFNASVSPPLMQIIQARPLAGF